MSIDFVVHDSGRLTENGSREIRITTKGRTWTSRQESIDFSEIEEPKRSRVVEYWNEKFELETFSQFYQELEKNV